MHQAVRGSRVRWKMGAVSRIVSQARAGVRLRPKLLSVLFREDSAMTPRMPLRGIALALLLDGDLRNLDIVPMPIEMLGYEVTKCYGANAQSD